MDTDVGVGALSADGFQDVVVLGKARVPVVKFVDPKNDIDCDICINNLLALENTRLLQSYCNIDPRLRALGLCIKHWAKQRYAVCLLGIVVY